MTGPPDSSALSHLRVLDLTRARAGPTCCRILADFGADVLKIDAPPGVDPNEGMSGARDGYDMINLHRNKRSLTLNLKKTKAARSFCGWHGRRTSSSRISAPTSKSGSASDMRHCAPPIRASFSPRSPASGRLGPIAYERVSIKLRKEWAA